MSVPTVRDLDVEGRRVFVRADLNVPLREGVITDDTRIRASLPTVHYVLDHGGSVILASHLGRPRGQRVTSLSLRPVAERLSQLLGLPVSLSPDVAGTEARRLASRLEPGQVLMLENLRFCPEEEKNEAEFSHDLASLADLYVNDAFGAAHRAHASTTGITAFLPSAAGLLMERELRALNEVLHHPRHPLAVLVGGAKISSKVGVLENLLGIADLFLIGGGMANTFLKAQGVNVGASLVEDDALGTAQTFLHDAEERGRQVYLPVDVVITDRVEGGADATVVPVDGVPEDQMIVDIGPRTVERFCQALHGVRQVVWNGPMGVCEVRPFAEGTRAMAEVVANAPAWTLVGGGDSVAAVQSIHMADKFDHVSTGGGASLEFLEGRTLPGIAALERDETTVRRAQ